MGCLIMAVGGGSCPFASAVGNFLGGIQKLAVSLTVSKTQIPSLGDKKV